LTDEKGNSSIAVSQTTDLVDTEALLDESEAPMMADSTQLHSLSDSPISESFRHSLVVRITHWIHAISFLGLVVSGIGILLAHPRFYWGETGGLGTPSLFDLPLPFILGGPSGWGRYLHFQSAWVCILTGMLYVTSGVCTGHFRKNLAPERRDISPTSVWRVVSGHLRLEEPGDGHAHSYNVLQRLSYLAVVFLVTPLMIWTGMAMSPAVVSVFPFFVTSLRGHQTARTLHFFTAIFLVLFLFVHVGLVTVAGFTTRMRNMIFGHERQGRQSAAEVGHL
jgi:thiosulfate reductase cytochrome b subunit